MWLVVQRKKCLVLFQAVYFICYIFNQLADINECLEDRSVCQGGDCINTEGSYDCTCPEGFQINENKGCQGTFLPVLPHPSLFSLYYKYHFSVLQYCLIKVCAFTSCFMPINLWKLVLLKQLSCVCQALECLPLCNPVSTRAHVVQDFSSGTAVTVST